MSEMTFTGRTTDVVLSPGRRWTTKMGHGKTLLIQNNGSETIRIWGAEDRVLLDAGTAVTFYDQPKAPDA